MECLITNWPIYLGGFAIMFLTICLIGRYVVFRKDFCGSETNACGYSPEVVDVKPDSSPPILDERRQVIQRLRVIEEEARHSLQRLAWVESEPAHIGRCLEDAGKKGLVPDDERAVIEGKLRNLRALLKASEHMLIAFDAFEDRLRES